MNKIRDLNINLSTYWDGIYGTREKRQQYAVQGTDVEIVDDTMIRPTARFQTALDQIKPGQKVLDMGCGVGVFTKLVKVTLPECEVWGTDISGKAMADNTFERPDIKYLQQEIGNQTNLPNDYFDVVFSGEVLEHLDHPEDLFKDAYRVLKPRGRFVVTTPRESAVQSPEHVWEFTQEDVETLFLNNGFDRVLFSYLPDGEHLAVIFAVGIKK